MGKKKFYGEYFMSTLRNEMIDFSLYELKVINNASKFLFGRGEWGGEWVGLP